MDSELAQKQLVLAMLWSRYCHVRESSESQCEAKATARYSACDGQDGLRKTTMPNIYSFIDVLAQQM